MLNRTEAPNFNQVDQINFIAPKEQILANGIKVFTLNAGQQELVRIEFIFSNVNWDSTKPLQAVAVNSLINNGTKKLSAKQIADQIDYYGAFLQTEYAADQTIITLYSLNKHLTSVLPIVWSILNESVFPEKELSIFVQNQKQKLQVNLQKNDFLARKTFANAIFGNTPYGMDIAAADYDLLKREDLLAYYQAAFKPENCTIVAAGKFGLEEFELLDKFFGRSWENHGADVPMHFTYQATAGKEIYLEKSDAVQSALRIGQLSINRKHADFPSLQILNCVLGGYFGSRLMANIREDKGYTYGIGSGISALKDAGYFFIATEVGTEVCNEALREIEKEINLLQTTLVGEQELNLVRSYMLGAMLGSLENAFSHADKFKNIYFSGLGYDYYQKYIQTVKSITSEEILATANTYLNWNEMTKVIVGKKN
jgi:zinc protease